MGISPLSNSGDLVARNALARSSRAINTSLERLATGKRINRASDDPAGAVAATDLEGREKSLKAKIDALSLQDAYLGAREGSQSVISELLIDLTGLVVTAANRDGLSEEERRGLQIEADSIIKTIDHLANTSTFKGEQILSGFNSANLGRLTQPTDAAPGSTDRAFETFSLTDLRAGGRLNLFDGNAELAQKVVEAASGSVNDSRAAIGARSKGLASELRSLQTELENTSAAKSAIVDTDFAKETAELVRNQVLQEAATYAALLARDQVRTLVVNLLKPDQKAA